MKTKNRDIIPRNIKDHVSAMYKIFKLVKTEWYRPGDGSYHTARCEQWTFMWVASYENKEVAEENLEIMVTEDPDPASDWRKKKVYAEITYAEYQANPHNYHHRKYFLTTPEYTMDHLIHDITDRLGDDGVHAM